MPIRDDGDTGARARKSDTVKAQVLPPAAGISGVAGYAITAEMVDSYDLPAWVKIIALFFGLALPLLPKWREAVDAFAYTIKTIRGAFGAVVLAVILIAMIPGCAGLGGTGIFRPAIGDHSAVEVKFEEKTPDGGVLNITFTANGEAALQALVDYQGPVEEGWRLRVDGNGDVASPQSVVIAEGYAHLLRETPATLQGLATQIASVAMIPGLPEGNGDGGGLNIRELLIQTLIQRFAAAHGDSPLLDLIGGLP